MVVVSAPGKAHLIGEHAVVYGEPAVIAALGRRCVVTAEKSDAVEITAGDIDARGSFDADETAYFVNDLRNLWNMCADKKDFSELFSLMREDRLNPLRAAVGETLLRLRVDSGVQLAIASDIPVGSGLGSSAALAVAIPAAAAALYGKGVSQDQLNDIALTIEQFNHGTPSGGDNTACCYGSLIWFQKANPANVVLSLREEVPYPLDNFLFVHTTMPEQGTGEMVQHVRTLAEDVRTPRIKALGSAAQALRDALRARDFGKMQALLNFAQRTLAELGVSTPEIDELHRAVLGAGGAAKLTGAGGGGTVLCYHQDKNKLVSLLRDMDYEPWSAVLGDEGVRVEP